MPDRLQCTLVTFACFLLVSHECFALTCHDSRLFVCFSVCHAANDPETYKRRIWSVCPATGKGYKVSPAAAAVGGLLRCYLRDCGPLFLALASCIVVCAQASDLGELIAYKHHVPAFACCQSAG